MSKYVAIQRLHRAVLALREWRTNVDKQGAQQLWVFLGLKRKNVQLETWTFYGEPDDADFINLAMRVRDTALPFWDPVAAEFRIATHYHSNVATQRKGTFSSSWRALEQNPENPDQWRFSTNYLHIIKNKILTKSRKVTCVPLFDLLAWLYRTEAFDDAMTLEGLVAKFQTDYHLSAEETSTLFTSGLGEDVSLNEAGFFMDRRPSDAMILEIVTKLDSFNLSDALATELVARKAPAVELENLVALAQNGRRQMILQGPPGTGKTYFARQVAARLLGADSEIVTSRESLEIFLKGHQFSRLPSLDSLEPVVNQVELTKGTWDIVQFHPSYNYEDFVRGIAVKVVEGGTTPVFQVENRIFGAMADISTQTHYPIVLIIDEINRGDLSKVLGELVYALEYREQSVRTPYVLTDSATLTVGNHFYVIATMNTSDRSIALIDYAIRRRFDFVDLHPDRVVLENHLASVGLGSATLRVLVLFDAINKMLEGNPDYAIGHTYFMGRNVEDIARRVVFQVLPLLAEYRKERILTEGHGQGIGLEGWGHTGLPLLHPSPFDLAKELQNWFASGGSTAPVLGRVAVVAESIEPYDTESEDREDELGLLGGEET